LFRDGATGSTLDFDSKDEGSNPSPGAKATNLDGVSTTSR
jgi:hypothetical protein